MDTITVGALRRLLFDIGDQDMTVRDLRLALYDFDDQDAPVDPFAITR